MRQLFLLIILLSTLASCSDNTGKGNSSDRELVPNPEKYEHDGYSTLPDSLKPKFIPDTAIGELSLNNSENVDNYLGKDIMDKLNKEEDLPSAVILSNDKKQKLTIYFHPGGTPKEFSEFKIEFINSRATNGITVKDKNFITENGIELEISVGDLKSIKGEPDTIMTNGKETIYHYAIDDIKRSDFLKKYNMPIYYADYYFINGYLTEFKFGFDYP